MDGFRRWKKKWLIVALMLFVYSVPAQACTLWGAAGNAVQGGGTLLVKNRDWTPDHQQQLRLVNPQSGYRYVGLFADGKVPGLKAGINEKGLTVVSASVGSIPQAERRKMPKKRAVMAKLLATCESVDEALTRTDLFVGPLFLVLADKTKVAYIESGPNGQYAVHSETNGVLSHTNHYIETNMLEANRRIGASSLARYERISSLLHTQESFTANDFIGFSCDQSHGPDRSIWRTGGKPGGERTLATWMVQLPETGEPLLYLRLANPGEAEVIRQYPLSAIFTGSAGI